MLFLLGYGRNGVRVGNFTFCNSFIGVKIFFLQDPALHIPIFSRTHSLYTCWFAGLMIFKLFSAPVGAKISKDCSYFINLLDQFKSRFFLKGKLGFVSSGYWVRYLYFSFLTVDNTLLNQLSLGCTLGFFSQWYFDYTTFNVSSKRHSDKCFHYAYTKRRPAEVLLDQLNVQKLKLGLLVLVHTQS